LVAGGSKGSLKLFQDIFHLQSSSYEMRHTIEAARAASDAEKAVSKAEAAGTATTAEVEYAKAATALKRARLAAAKAAAEGKPVPEEALKGAELSLADAKAVIERKRSRVS
jgi:hypothetical protein